MDRLAGGPGAATFVFCAYAGEAVVWDLTGNANLGHEHGHGAAHGRSGDSEQQDKSLRVQTPLFGICCVGGTGGCQAEGWKRCWPAHRRQGEDVGFS